MKKPKAYNEKHQTAQPALKWQIVNFSRRQKFSFTLPYQFLLLCKLINTNPSDMLRDFMDNLSGELGNRQGSAKAKDCLINYFIANGYGAEIYTEEELRQIFQEMNAMGLLFPANGKMKLIDLYSHWRGKHHKYWFKKWYRKSGGLPY